MIAQSDSLKFYFDDGVDVSNPSLLSWEPTTLLVGEVSVSYCYGLFKDYQFEIGYGHILDHYIIEIPRSIMDEPDKEINPTSGQALKLGVKKNLTFLRDNMSVGLMYRHRKYEQEIGIARFNDLYFDFMVVKSLGKNIYLRSAYGFGLRFVNRDYELTGLARHMEGSDVELIMPISCGFGYSF